MTKDNFCPSCFARIPLPAEICPACGERVATLSERDHSEKLVHALEHPLTDVRMRAIIALGLRADDGAVPALLRCAWRNPIDIVEGLEIVNSLVSIGRGRRCLAALHELAERHPARAVRVAAAKALCGSRAFRDESELTTR